jgi:hypothetical protein
MLPTVIYQSHIDQTASSVLIGAAIRIAHAMRLESKSVLSELAPQEARQRANIFWLCYILDKVGSITRCKDYPYRVFDTHIP